MSRRPPAAWSLRPSTSPTASAGRSGFWLGNPGCDRWQVAFVAPAIRAATDGGSESWTQHPRLRWSAGRASGFSIPVCNGVQVGLRGSSTPVCNGVQAGLLGPSAPGLQWSAAGLVGPAPWAAKDGRSESWTQHPRLRWSAGQACGFSIPVCNGVQAGLLGSISPYCHGMQLGVVAPASQAAIGSRPDVWPQQPQVQRLPGRSSGLSTRFAITGRARNPFSIHPLLLASWRLGVLAALPLSLEGRAGRAESEREIGLGRPRRVALRGTGISGSGLRATSRRGARRRPSGSSGRARRDARTGCAGSCRCRRRLAGAAGGTRRARGPARLSA